MKIEDYLKIIDETIEKGKFKDDWQSLGNRPVPDWYKKGRFGLFIHWGVYSVPAFGNEWYPRQMYLKNTREYSHHKRVYGGVEKFGYDKFVPMFKAEKFDAEEWLDIFAASGAKYIMPVGEHHDGFKMYKSELNRWNAAEKGPCRDVLAELRAAAESRGIGFLTSSHRAEHYWFMSGAKSLGEKNDCDDPELADFYGPLKNVEGRSNFENLAKCDAGIVPDEEWLCDWLASSCEMIDKNRPLAVYFDWWVTQSAFRPYMKKFLAYYYNRAEEWKKQVTVFYKVDSVMQGAAVYDVERGQLSGVSPYVWQNDTSIAKNSWGYTENNNFKTAAEVARNLVDVISKNGCFMLNVGPKSDGTICREEKRVLLDLGKWLGYAGEAVYGSEPFREYGEGKKRAGGSFKENFRYNSADFRFTYKTGALYVFALGRSQKGVYCVKSLKGGRNNFEYLIKKATLLGGGEVEFEQNSRALVLKTHAEPAGDMPLCFKLEID